MQTEVHLIEAAHYIANSGETTVFSNIIIHLNENLSLSGARPQDADTDLGDDLAQTIVGFCLITRYTARATFYPGSCQKLYFGILLLISS